MLFIIISIIGSCLIKFFWSSKCPLPYSSALLFLGIILAIISEEIFDKEENLFTDTIDFWFTINPDRILLIFIPPLIYNSSAHINFHIFRKSIWSILLLILPGVIISTAITAVFMKIIDSNFDWKTSILTGSILSATDPVAVINILEMMNISKNLSILIEGESLLNDGTSYVLFIIILHIIRGDSDSKIIKITLQLAFGGLVFGFVMGIVLFYILKNVYNNATIEISLTIVFCYFTFFMAENVLDVSSILSVSILGFVMAYLGNICITPYVKKSMENVWTIIDFIANNIIFVLTGLIIIKNIYKSKLDEWLNLFILFLVVNFARMIIIFLFYPLLKNDRYKIKKGQLLIVSLSGLRGAITLVLSLITSDEKSISKNVSERIIFYSAGIVFLSIVFNSIIIKIIIKYCPGMIDHNSKLISKVLHIREHLYNIGKENISDIKNRSSFYLRNVAWRTVENKIINVKEDDEMDITIPIENQLLQSRRIFLKTFKKSCWFLYDKKRILYRDTILTLIELIDNILDSEQCHWEHMIEDYCKHIVVSSCLKGRLCQFIRRKYLVHIIRHKYNIVSGFILGQQHTMDILSDILTDINIIEQLQEESNLSIDCALKFLHYLEENFPITTKKIETKQSIYNVLQTQRKDLVRLYKNGEINEEIFEHISQEIDEKLYHTEIII